MPVGAAAGLAVGAVFLVDAGVAFEAGVALGTGVAVEAGTPFAVVPTFVAGADTTEAPAPFPAVKCRMSELY